MWIQSGIFICLFIELDLGVAFNYWAAVIRGVFEAALVFMWGSPLRSGGDGHWVIILWGLDTFLIFPNFLRSWILRRFATREATRVSK